MNPKNVYDALAYLTECTLATVADLKMKKSAPKSKTARQINIAQIGVDWCRSEQINLESIHATRAHEVSTKFNGRVEDWAKKYNP